MLLDKSPLILALLSLLFSLCLAAVVLSMQQKISPTYAQSTSNQARAVLDHYAKSHAIATSAREQVEAAQANYLAAYHARRQLSIPVIEEVQ